MWFCVILLIGQFFLGHANEVHLKIEGGSILGRIGLTEGYQNKYFAFQGIPYAEPPERFELAVPKKPWSKPLNCTFDKAECVQLILPDYSVIGSEDCLFLSVYTRKLEGKRPTLVYIHGGAFMGGNSFYESNGPDYFLDEDLVVVSIQYRLGIFGFMSTGDLACPGNLGLKDQNLALKWVQKNIRYFGGDPDNVSIMGQSAGAASVAMHLNSPTSKGLFKRAIMNSGVSTCSWSLHRRARKTAFEIGHSFRIKTTNSTILVNELKKVDYLDLAQTSSVVSYLETMDNPLSGILYGPVKELEHNLAFFTGNSEEMLSTGNFTKVPVLVGFTTNEMAAFAQIFNSLIESQPTYLNSTFIDHNSTKLVPADLTTNSNNRASAAVKIKKKYFEKDLSIEAFYKFANIDLFFRPIDKFVTDVSKYVNEVYYYMFSYVGDEARTDQQQKDAQHSDDLHYLFKTNLSYSENDKIMRKMMVRMWSNFCKSSKPIPTLDSNLQNATWLPASKKQPPFLMNIGSTLEQIRNPFQEDLDFYKDIYTEYGDGVYGTY